MLFLLTWNAIFALVYYTNRPTGTLNHSTDFRLHQTLQKTTSRLIALYKDQLRWDLTQLSFRRNVDSKRRYQDTITMGKAGEELKNLVTRSLPLESLVALRENFLCFFPWSNWLPLGSPRIPFPSPWHFFSLPTPYVSTETFTSHWLNIMACKDGDLKDHWSNEERSPFRSYLRL